MERRLLIAERLLELEANSGATPALLLAGESRAPRTWSELVGDALATAATLRRQGVARGEFVAVISENRYEWLLVDLALHLLSAVHVPLHASLAGPQVAELVEHCRPTIWIASHPAQAAKLALARVEPRVCFLFDAPDAVSASGAGARGDWLSWRDELASCQANDQAAIRREAVNNADPDAVATILYTSGTTGVPKGVVLTHDNLVFAAEGMSALFPPHPDELKINVLPLSHIFARTCDLYVWLLRGTRFALARSRETLIDDCRELAPTTFNGVPFLFDRIRKVVGDSPAPGALRSLLGGRIEFCCSGGAPLPPSLGEFYERQGLPILQGYGLTETSPVISGSSLARNRLGAAGPAIPGVELRIADDGEILTRGRHVMRGYYRAPEATAAVLRDGWFHTGDLGRIDDDGFLWITGRKKEMIVTTGGKKIAPTRVEGLILEEPAIQQAVVVGEGRDYLVALLRVDPGLLRKGPDAIDLADSELQTLLLSRISGRLSCLSPFEQVRRIALLPRPLDIDHGELTTKLSLRRERIAENWRELIETMYR